SISINKIVSVSVKAPVRENGLGKRGKMKKIKRDQVSFLFVLLALTLTLIPPVYSGERKPVKPSPKDKCPVCGMFVAKYPDFLAEILFKDGSYAIFDGTKDMLKYYFNVGKFSPSKKQSEIDSTYVTDYYSLTFIDAYSAYYVLGGDIYGPMGKELIPLGKEGDAKEFMKDHRGKSILRFRDITQEIVKVLD
ncbi:MAG: nitrous oxide reductase accessory protein NosL, partial [Pseudobdellovibrio sp.]